jgi:hypothetical protein
MKKIILNLSFITILTILFSSCGSISITQKRYSNGLNIDWFAAKDKKDNTQNQTLKRKAKSNPSNSLTKQTETNENEFVNDFQTSEFNLNENSTKTEDENIVNNHAISIQNKKTKRESKTLNNSKRENSKVVNKVSKLDVKQSIKAVKKTKKFPNKTNDTPFIILFILALFPGLTLLAIYLYYGEINFHFWLNLILLLIGGGLYTSMGFLGISFAVIHALLVIFGVF